MTRRFLIDLTPLRASADFRRLFFGQAISMIGSQLTVVAIAFQVYELTHSSLQVGAVSLAQLGPFVAGALVGGSVAEAVGRRWVLMVTSALLALTSGGLALNALSGRNASVLAIYLVTAIAAGLSGALSTAATAVVPSLVGQDQLTSAYATMQVIDQVGMVAGPALSGLLISGVGLPWLFGIDSLTFVWAASCMWRLVDTPSVRSTARPGMRSMLEGFTYLRGRQALQGAYVIDLFATVFGLPRALFPALTRTVFHGGPALLGVLYATPAAGAFIASLTSRWLNSIRRQGRVVIAAVIGYGVLIVVFGFTRVLWLALVLLAAAGFADLISAVLRSTIVQSVVAERLRSRISALQMAVVEGGPRLGDLESGAVATVSIQFSVVSGGLTCVVGALALAVLLPGFRRYARPSQGE